MQLFDKADLPRLGVGLSFRPEIGAELCERLTEVDFMEVILDNEISGLLGRDFWERVVPRVPMVGHAVNASIGSLDFLDVAYVKSISRIAERMNCRWFSEHLSFTHYRDVDTGQLQPVQFSEWNLRFLARKIRKMSRIFGRPVLIENSAYYYTIPGSTLGEAEFIARLLAEARCGLLLDVNNLYANALNHNYDPHRFIDCMPTHAVVEIHVAGGETRNGVYIDTHGHPVNDDVLELLEYAVATKRPNGIVLEREKNFPPIGQILEEVRTLKEIWCRADRRLPVVA